jgi:hypothetical protein
LQYLRPDFHVGHNTKTRLELEEAHSSLESSNPLIHVLGSSITHLKIMGASKSLGTVEFGSITVRKTRDSIQTGSIITLSNPTRVAHSGCNPKIKLRSAVEQVHLSLVEQTSFLLVTLSQPSLNTHGPSANYKRHKQCVSAV